MPSQYWLRETVAFERLRRVEGDSWKIADAEKKMRSLDKCVHVFCYEYAKKIVRIIQVMGVHILMLSMCVHVLNTVSQVVQVHQETVDLYLEDIIFETLEQTADQQAREEIRRRAKEVNDIAYAMEER